MLVKLVFVVAALVVGPVWAVNKCVVGGQTVYQDAPCAGGGGTALSLPRSPQPSADDAGRASADLQQLQHRNAIAEGIRTNKPVVGMTRKELDQAMGMPNAVNAGNYGGVLKDQLVYYRPNGTWYAYTTNGVVDSVQASAPMPQAQQTAPRLARCPSSLEIRNVEITADNLGITTEQRRLILRRVADMRACQSM